jgi:integrase
MKIHPLRCSDHSVAVQWLAAFSFRGSIRNPLSSKPYYSTEIQKRYLKPAGIKLGLGPIGWHTFCHTYRSWLDETGAPMKVQQELMRHASIQTTMNVYGQAMPESKREANGKVVTMVLKPLKASA